MPCYLGTVYTPLYVRYLLKRAGVELGAAVPDELVQHPLKAAHVALVRR